MSRIHIRALLKILIFLSSSLILHSHAFVAPPPYQHAADSTSITSINENKRSRMMTPPCRRPSSSSSFSPLKLLVSSSSSASASESTSDKETSTNIKFRPGRKQDELEIKLTMARNLMNPLNLDSKRFIVAVNAKSNDNSRTNSDSIYGWAQLRPIGSTLRNPQEYNALPGSGSIETNIEEEIWQDFENDQTEFPNGFASLPWTKEYKEFSKSSQTRLKKRNQMMEQKETERIRGQNQLWELASVYVKPEWRKRGIGRELIRRVMARHDLLERSRGDVYLLTLDRTEDFYRGLGFGFEVTDEPPASMAGEIVAGNLITGLMGSKLVCMRGGGTGTGGEKGGGRAPSL